MSEPQGVDETFGARADLAREYVRLLGSVGLERGLLGPREVPRLWDRHVCNSANAAGLLPAGVRVADVGSGAGLPGIPLALARPDVSFTLIESMARRTTFLQEVVDVLGLGEQVRVLRARAEDVVEEFDVVTSRAVAPLTKLLPWCAPLVGRGGFVMALKGESASEEVASVAGLLQKLGGVAEVVDVSSHLTWPSTRVVRISTKDDVFHVIQASRGKN